MNRSFALAAIAVSVLLSLVTAGTPPQPGPGQDAAGIEPLTRGPVHEAFAEPTVAHPDPSPLVPKQPPEPIEELPPDQKPAGDNVQWIPGYWQFDEDQGDYVWISGFWRDVPPDHRWVPGYWAQAKNEWQWAPGYWADVQQTQVSYVPAPPAPLAATPSVPAPGADYAYAPGNWMWRDTRFLWRPGFWVQQRPNWVYSPARYCWTPAGWFFAEGYWDYPLHRRGLLFAPVALNYRLARPAGWNYRPSYVISSPALLAALFARPTFGHYYFGDYFGPTYRQAGYVPWLDYQVARNVPNPTAAYYHWQHERDLLVDLRQQYKLREQGLAPRPPIGYAHQTTLIEHINVNKSVVINKETIRIENPKLAVQHLTMVTPLAKVNQNVKFLDREVKLERVNKEVMAREEKHIAEVRKVATVRREFDAKHVTVEVKKTTPHPKLTLPAPVAHREAVKTTVERPPHPKLPAHSEKQVAEPRKEVKTPRVEVRPRPPVNPKENEKKGPALKKDKK